MPAFFLVGVFAQPYAVEDIPRVQEEIEKVLERFKTTPVTEKELADLKSRYKYGLAGGLNIPFNVGNILANYIWLTGDPESLNRAFNVFEQLTAQDIMDAANKYFKKERRTVVTLSAEEKAR